MASELGVGLVALLAKQGNALLGRVRANLNK